MRRTHRGQRVAHLAAQGVAGSVSHDSGSVRAVLAGEYSGEWKGRETWCLCFRGGRWADPQSEIRTVQAGGLSYVRVCLKRARWQA